MEKEIKKIITDLGASVCGISSVERFKDVPEGFHQQIYGVSASLLLPLELIYQRGLQNFNHHLYMVISIISAVQ